MKMMPLKCRQCRAPKFDMLPTALLILSLAVTSILSYYFSERWPGLISHLMRFILKGLTEGVFGTGSNSYGTKFHQIEGICTNNFRGRNK